MAAHGRARPSAECQGRDEVDQVLGASRQDEDGMRDQLARLVDADTCPVCLEHVDSGVDLGVCSACWQWSCALCAREGVCAVCGKSAETAIRLARLAKPTMWHQSPEVSRAFCASMLAFGGPARAARDAGYCAAREQIKHVMTRAAAVLERRAAAVRVHANSRAEAGNTRRPAQGRRDITGFEAPSWGGVLATAGQLLL